MSIVQISDCHVVNTDQRISGGVDPAALLRSAVDAIGMLPLQPDLILITGDLVNAGAPEEYGTFLDIIGGVRAPIVPVTGNHDLRENLAEAFRLSSRFALQEPFIQYVVEDYPVRIIVLDTATTGSGQPSMCPDRLSWLSDRLAESDRPTLIAMHHPPFPAGVAWMEPKEKNWASQLAQIVAGHPSIVRVVCGHVHRTMTVQWASTCAMAAPSTAHQVYPDLTSSAPPRFNLEAPGFLMHQWIGSLMVSYGAAIPGISKTFAP
jgi:3',5'-cyclic-AMP phosphodiesterase